MTVDEARLLPPLVSIETAGAALGWGKVQAYQHLKAGDWPPEVEVVRRPNARWKVKTATLLRYLGIEPAGHHRAPSPESVEPGVDDPGSTTPSTREEDDGYGNNSRPLRPVDEGTVRSS